MGLHFRKLRVRWVGKVWTIQIGGHYNEMAKKRITVSKNTNRTAWSFERKKQNPHVACQGTNNEIEAEAISHPPKKEHILVWNSLDTSPLNLQACANELHAKLFPN